MSQLLALPTPEPVFVTGIPGFDITRRKQMLMPAGQSVLEFARSILPGVPDECFFEDGRAYMGDFIIPGRLWVDLRPPSGTSLVIRIVPGNSAVFRTGLQIAVMVAAISASAYLGPALIAAGYSSGFASVASGMLGAGITIVGNLLINAFVPVRDKAKGREESYSFDGFRNGFAPDAPFTVILGEHRVALPHIARPFTESTGDNQIATNLFGCYGPLDVADIKNGDTPIEKYAGVGAPADGELLEDFFSEFFEIEIRRGYADDDPITLYPTQVIEVPLNIDLSFTAASGSSENWAGDPVVRVTPRDITGYSIDLTFPEGIGRMDRQGRERSLHIDVRVRERLLGTPTWTTVFDDHFSGQEFNPITRTIQRVVPERGTYEIEVWKFAVDEDQGREHHRTIWTAIRGLRPEYPINFSKPMFLIATRIRASGQLNGTVDELNCKLTSICPDWDAGTDTWIPRATRNPASLFRYVLQGPMKLRPVPDAQINLEQLQERHEYCTENNLTYDRIHDFESTPWDVLADVASAMRATPQRLGGKWGIVPDGPRDRITAAITPQNSWGFQEDIPQLRLPDALRMGFNDRENGWVRAERVVPLPGFVGDPQIIRAIDLPGLTDPEIAHREGLRIGYGLQLRKRTITVSQDFQSLLTLRGDLAGVSHDVLTALQMNGRVRSMHGMLVESDQDVSFEAGEDYGVRFLADGGTELDGIWTVAPPSAESITARLFTLLPPDAGPSPPMPVAGDQFFLGPIARVVEELLVKGVQRGENNTAKLILVDHRPEIEALVAEATVPPWDPRVGQIGPAPIAPAIPVIVSVLSSTLAPGGTVRVTLRPGVNGGTVSSYDVEHRLQGAGSWTVVSAPGGNGAVSFGGYSFGDTLEVRARAIGLTGLQSGYIVLDPPHVFGADDPAIPVITDFSVLRLTGGLWRYDFTIDDPDDVAIGVNLRYRAGIWTDWDDLAPLNTGPITVSPWDSSVPEDDGLYTFGARPVDEDENELGAAVLITAGLTALIYSDPRNSAKWLFLNAF